MNFQAKAISNMTTTIDGGNGAVHVTRCFQKQEAAIDPNSRDTYPLPDDLIKAQEIRFSRLRNFYVRVAATTGLLGAAGLLNPARKSEYSHLFNDQKDMYAGGALFGIACVATWISQRMNNK